MRKTRTFNARKRLADLLDTAGVAGSAPDIAAGGGTVDGEHRCGSMSRSIEIGTSSPSARVRQAFAEAGRASCLMC